MVAHDIFHIPLLDSSSPSSFAQAFFQKAWQAFGKAPDSYNLGEIFAQAFFKKLGKLVVPEHTDKASY